MTTFFIGDLQGTLNKLALEEIYCRVHTTGRPFDFARKNNVISMTYIVYLQALEPLFW